MSTESLAVEQRVPVVVRFAYSQVVRNGWSKQNCTSYLISHGFNRFALHHITASGEEDDQPNLLIYLIDPITDPNIVRTQITEGPNSIIKNLPLLCVGVLSDRPERSEFLRNYSRQYRREAMHNTHLVHLRYFWEGPCESNIPNRLRLGMIERSISSDDGGVDDASDEGYTDGLYPDFPKRWRKKEELAYAFRIIRYNVIIQFITC